MNPRWENYYLDPDFDGFWTARLSRDAASACIIIGVGFDPRSLLALDRISRCTNKQNLGFVALDLRPPSEMGEAYKKLEGLTNQNKQRLASFSGAACLGQDEVALRDKDGYLVGGRTALRIINGLLPKIAKFEDVIVDISGLPRTIFFPLIALLCKRADEGSIKNLHVIVTEDSSLDNRIRAGEYGLADYIYTFRLESAKRLVWLPLVSESESLRLQKIHNQIGSACIEICPILPFPARTLRRSDDILVGLREVLFEKMLVSRDNLLLCDERSPFDVYRKIIEVDDYYRERLSILPGINEITTVVSPLAGKMLSLGMLLAAIERKLPVSYVEAGSYRIDENSDDLTTAKADTSPVEIWLTGEPYK